MPRMLHAFLIGHGLKLGRNWKLPPSWLALLAARGKYAGWREEMSPTVLLGYGARVLLYQHALQDVPMGTITA